MVFIGVLGDHKLGIDHSDSLEVLLRDFDHFFVRGPFPWIKTKHAMKDRLVFIRTPRPLVFEILCHQTMVMSPYPLRL
jgi:hypothetical protein